MQTILNSLTRFFTSLIHRFLPEPFVFAISLTILTVILGLVVEGKSIIDMTVYWGKGFWSLLAFTTQMALMIVTGYVLAKAPIVDKGVDVLVKVCKTPKKAIAVATIVGGVCSYLNWGFGLIVGALIARKMATAIKGVHYPLIMAAAYSGFVFYALGITGTIPVLIATQGHFLEKEMGIVPLSDTIFTLPILLIGIVLMITLPIINAMAQPKNPEDIIELDPSVYASESTSVVQKVDMTNMTLAEKMNNSPVFTILICLFGFGYLGYYFATGGSLNINTVNLLLMLAGLACMKTPTRYVTAFSDAAKSMAGIVLQFPFYGGIMGMLSGSGLVSTIAAIFVSISTAETLPFWGLVSSFIINFFAPSAGGHWVIQGPFMIEAAHTLGANPATTAMSVMLGNGWNDLVQPFWLLPTLAISGLKLGDIMGYTVICMIWTGIVFSVGVLLWGAML